RRQVRQRLGRQHLAHLGDARQGRLVEDKAGLARSHGEGKAWPHQNRSGTWMALTSTPVSATSCSSSAISGSGGGAANAASASAPARSAIAVVTSTVTPGAIGPRNCGTSVRA